jgi:hypothetical protein
VCSYGFAQNMFAPRLRDVPAERTALCRYRILRAEDGQLALSSMVDLEAKLCGLCCLLGGKYQKETRERSHAGHSYKVFG